MNKFLSILLLILLFLVLGIGAYYYVSINQKITIFFNTQTASTINNMEIKKGEKINLPQIEREGYNFLGWYVGDTKINSEYHFNQSTIVMARWEKGAYVIKFDTDGGNTISDMQVTCGKEIGTLPTPTKNGYTFVGWQDEKGNSVDCESKLECKNITLKAKWQENVQDNPSNQTPTCQPYPSCTQNDYKPLLYLYPKAKTKIKVTFEKPELLTTTYPKFIDKWEVTAYSNGDLYDKDGKYYYGLYWEDEDTYNVDFSEGFYVEKEDAISFLEEKLSKIGLNDRERNEFIMYWLPIMEKNEKNLIYFELTDEYQSHNYLYIDPKPDSLLRVLMHVKKVDKKVSIKEQKLETFQRVGFVAVEWGGRKY